MRSLCNQFSIPAVGGSTMALNSGCVDVCADHFAYRDDAHVNITRGGERLTDKNGCQPPTLVLGTGFGVVT